jgi:hypothetical protein
MAQMFQAQTKKNPPFQEDSIAINLRILSYRRDAENTEEKPEIWWIHPASPQNFRGILRFS